MIPFNNFFAETCGLGSDDVDVSGDGGIGAPKLARIIKDADGYYHFINAKGKDVLTVKDKDRAAEFKMHFMRKKRWKFKGDITADF